MRLCDGKKTHLWDETLSKLLVTVSVDVTLCVTLLVAVGTGLTLVLSPVICVSSLSVLDRLTTSVVLWMKLVLLSKINAPGPSSVWEKVTGTETVSVLVTGTISHTSWYRWHCVLALGMISVQIFTSTSEGGEPRVVRDCQGASQ